MANTEDGKFQSGDESTRDAARKGGQQGRERSAGSGDDR